MTDSTTLDSTETTEVKMDANDAARAYRNFYDSARNNSVLDPKTTMLIHLGTAMARGCYP